MVIAVLVIVCIFLFSALWSGAFGTGVLVLLFSLGAVAVYYGWIEDKKKQRQRKELKLKQLERTIRWNEAYQPRSQRNRTY